ncbi:hypothetical protein JIQ42_02655 [Leishmania sp. Namibia]|uniref:hypothetical protein n=1 Tax=Leishmania sp. Namibia TaxID=2802991 RepID=UPI001B4082BA|nr:hypothetical protein JIQ42_02655 [Leishmania sp. Namibia]
MRPVAESIAVGGGGQVDEAAHVLEDGGETRAADGAVWNTCHLKPAIREMLERLVIHEDRIIENLPAIKAPELMLIGNCVSLCAREKVEGIVVAFHYTGLVVNISSTAVTLRHVVRYTPVDYQAYLSRENNIRRVGHRGGCKSGVDTRLCAAESELRVGEDQELSSTENARIALFVDAAGSLTPALVLGSEEGLEATALSRRQEYHEPIRGTDITFVDHGRSAASTQAARQRRFRSFHGSCGPIPYVTFLRKSIHEVEFGRDPRGSFYSLFQDPAKHIGDMQYLRMFVRRYLVHTSEGNNPRQVPLYAYLSARCAWPNLDRELVKELVQEELVGLLKTDRAIEKEKKRSRIRGTAVLSALNNESPEPLFSRSVILNLRSVSRISCSVGVGVIFLTVVFVIYTGVVLSVLGDPLIVRYSVKSLGYYILSILVWAAAGVCIILHSVWLRSPLRPHVETLMISSIWSAGAGACAIMIMVITAEHLTNRSIYSFMSTAPVNDLCSFYKKYKCSGPFKSCENLSLEMCRDLCAVLMLYTRGCYDFFLSRLQVVTIPLLVLSILVGLLVLYSFLLLWRQFRLAGSMSARMPVLGPPSR